MKLEFDWELDGVLEKLGINDGDRQNLEKVLLQMAKITYDLKTARENE